MLSDETIKELRRAFEESPRGFLVVDSGKPAYAVIDFDTYEKLRENSELSPKEPLSNKKKILVTGGAGYIGSHATRLLQKLGHEVLVYDNLSTGRESAVKDCELVTADLADRQALKEVFENHDIGAVMHFAASTQVEESVKNPAKYFRNNVVNGLNLLDTMVEYGVDKLIFSSTCAVYGSPQKLPVDENVHYAPESPYGLSKMIFEDILRWYAHAYKLNSISLRYFNAGGAWVDENLGYELDNNSLLIPRVMDVASGRTAEVKVFGQDYNTHDGTAIRDYIHVLDVADAHISALKKLDNLEGANFFNVGTGHGNTVLEVIDTAVEATGRMIPMTFSPRRSGDPEKLYADINKIKQELGWKPKYKLSDIMQSSWRWHQKVLGI